MPLLGSIADVQGMKIKFFLGFFGTGVVTCCAMALPLTWLPFLVVYILATIGLNGSLTFYDSMLIDATSNERMDKVSSHGYGWGYIGSTVPFIFCIALIFGGPSLFDWSTVACTRASFIITAIWWVAFTIPLLTSYRQVHYRATRDQLGSAVRGTFSELAGTFGKIVKCAGSGEHVLLVALEVEEGFIIGGVCHGGNQTAGPVEVIGGHSAGGVGLHFLRPLSEAPN